MLEKTTSCALMTILNVIAVEFFTAAGLKILRNL